jgi:DNA repair protein RadA/Sms
MEGSRPILAEVQTLVSSSVYPSPKRTSQGIDYNRLALILAVLEKRLGYRLSANDVYVNVAGGLRIDEPAADLALALSLISSYKNVAVSEDTVAFGEVGLAGECRSVSNIEQRVGEAARMGFKHIILPKRSTLKSIPDGVEIFQAVSVFDLLRFLGI